MRLSPVLLVVFAFAIQCALGDTTLNLVHPTASDSLSRQDTIVLFAPVDLDAAIVDHVFAKDQHPLWPYASSIPFRIMEQKYASLIDNVLSTSKRDSLRLQYSMAYTCEVKQSDTLLLILDGVAPGKEYRVYSYGIPYVIEDSTGSVDTLLSAQQDWTLRSESPLSFVESVFPSSGPLYCGETVRIRFSDNRDLDNCVPELDHGLILEQEHDTPGSVYVQQVEVHPNSNSIEIALGGIEAGSSFSLSLNPDVFSSIQNHELALNYYVPAQNSLVLQKLFQGTDGRLIHGKPDTLLYDVDQIANIDISIPGHRTAKVEILATPFESDVMDNDVYVYDACSSVEPVLVEALYIPTSTTTVTVPDFPQLSVTVMNQAGEVIGGPGVYTYSDSPIVLEVKAQNGYKFTRWDVVEEWGPVPDAMYNTSNRLSYMAKIGGIVELNPNIEVVPPCQEYELCVSSVYTDNFLNMCSRTSLDMADVITTTNFEGCHVFSSNNEIGITAEVAPEYANDYVIVAYKVDGQWVDFDPPGSSVSAKIRPGHCSSPKNIEIVTIPFENVRVDVSSVLENPGVASVGLDGDYQVRVFAMCSNGEELLTNENGGGDQTHHVALGSTLRIEYVVANPELSHVSFMHWQYQAGFTHPYEVTPPVQPDVVSFEIVATEDLAIQAVFQESFHLTDIGFFVGDNTDEVAWTSVQDLAHDPITDVDVSHIDGFGMGAYLFLRFSHPPLLETALHGGIAIDEVSQRMDVHRYKLGELETYTYDGVDLLQQEENVLIAPIVKQHSIVDNLPTGIPKGELFRVFLRGISTQHSNGVVETMKRPYIVRGETEMPGMDIIFKGARVLEHSYDGDVELMHFYKSSIVSSDGITNFYNDGQWSDSSLRANSIGKLPHHCYDELDKDDYPTTSYNETLVSIDKLDKSDIAFLHTIGFDYDNLDSQCDSTGFVEAAEDFYNGVVMDELEGPFEARYLIENLHLDSLYIEITNETDLATLFEGAIVVLLAVLTVLLLEGFYQLLMGWCPEILGDRTWSYGRDAWWGAHPSWQHQQDWVRSTDLRHDVEFKLRLED